MLLHWIKVRQRRHSSPLLFNIYIQYVTNEALEDIHEGVKVGGVRIPAIRFADDQAIVSHAVRGLQVIMDALQSTSEKYNMKINTKKNKENVAGRSMGVDPWVDRGTCPLLFEVEGTPCVLSPTPPYFFGSRHCL